MGAKRERVLETQQMPGAGSGGLGLQDQDGEGWGRQRTWRVGQGEGQGKGSPEAGGAAAEGAPEGGPVLERAEGDPVPSCHLAQGAQFLDPSARQLSFDLASPTSKYRNLMENGSPMVSHCI